jgi:intein/homing endonuclease
MADPKHDSSGLTKEFIKSEFLKCADSVEYFLDQYGYIRTEEFGIKRFELFDYQREILQELQENRYLAVLKSRQLGVSTIIAGFIAWYILFRKARHVFIMATKREKAGISFEMVKTFVTECPQWLRLYSVVKNNSMRFELSNGSWVKSQATSMDAGVGEAASLFFIDEAALIEKLREHWVGLFPTISCVTGNTMILTESGFKRIDDICKDINEGEYSNKVNGLKIYGRKGIEEVSHAYVSPKSKTKIITTRHGLQLETTLIHPLLKLTENGSEMTAMENLKIGDCLRVDVDMNVWGNNNFVGHKQLKYLTKNFAYILGGYVAEGWITGSKDINDIGNGVLISNEDDEFRKVFLKNKVIKEFHSQKPDYEGSKGKLICCSKEMVRLFKAIGINRVNKSHTKHIPEKIFECSKEIIGSFLSGLFDGDGCIGEKGDIVLVSSSHKLLIQTQLLLLNFGIVSYIRLMHDDDLQKLLDKGCVLPRGKLPKSAHNCWKLSISRSYLTVFKQNIGFRIKRKNDRLRKQSKERIQIWKRETIPKHVVVEQFKDIIKNSGKSKSFFRRNKVRTDLLYVDKYKKITFNWICKFVNIIREQNIKITESQDRLFNDLIEHRCFWDEIVDIKDSENITYDFTVPKTHSFLQNGIIGSNTGGRCVMASTPRGVGNKFWEIVTGAQNGENEFKVKEYPWSRRFSREWFEKERIGKTTREIAQEYECKFLESGNTFLDTNIFEKINETICEPIQKRGDLWIWKSSEFDQRYLIGADVARGDGGDFSAFCVMNVATGEVVAEYRGKIKTNDFSEFLVNIGREYNNALIIPESNSYGDAVIQKILELEYEDLYFSTRSLGGMPFGVLTCWESTGNKSAKAGLHTTSTSRPSMLQKLEELLRLGAITIRSKRCYDEFTTFIWKGQRPEATRGSTDDIIMSLAICAVIKDRHFKEIEKTIQKIDTLVSGFISSREAFDIGKKPNNNNEAEHLALLIAKI